MTSAAALLAIAPGPPEILRSSAALAWEGFLLEKHLSSPGERVGACIDRHVVSMLCGRQSHFEYRSTNGRPAPSIEAPGTITTVPVGQVPDVRLHTTAELLHCVFEEDFIRRVVTEVDGRAGARATFRSGLRETSMQRLLNLLLEELDSEAPSGRLYADSLACALATRYLLMDRASTACSESRTSALPLRILHRVRERIEADFHTDISLDTLAGESGYSRAHFLRMFRVATGITPHQYVLNVRLNHACESLKRRRESLIDIAALCGFSSQSHMTTVFRKRLGMTPAEFRRASPQPSV